MQTYLEYLPLVLSGTWVTIQVALASLAVAVVLGILGALGKLSDQFFVKKLVTAYTTFIRGVPDLILIFLFYYGGQFFINWLTESFSLSYYELSPFVAGFITIGFVYGAYMTETFRGAILAIKKGQIEAAYSLGMNSAQVFRKITFPLMVRFAVPGFMNNWLVLIKSTALISIIGLEDIVRRSNMASSITKMPFSFLFTASMVYVVITSLSLLCIYALERKFRVVE